MMDVPAQITVARLLVVVMPTGEVICDGKSLGWVKDLGRFLTPATPVALAHDRRRKQ